MGCYYSKFERKEMVSRCKARKRYMKQFVKARNSFSAAHSMYLRSLKNTGAALLQFATAESPLQHHNPPPPAIIPPPPPPPPMSQTSETWTTTSTTNTSSTPLPPPPPPPPSSSTWDFWDPFMPLMEGEKSVRGDEWEVVSATTVSETVAETTSGAAAPLKATSSDETPLELPVVVSSKHKDLIEIIKELDEYFLRAADSGGKLSTLLEIPASSGKINGNGMNLNPFFCSWNSSQRFNGLMKFDCNGMAGIGAVGGSAIPGSHCSTVVRLYEWERKLCEEVKNAESLKTEHEKKSEQLRKMELKKGDYLKIGKAKKEVEKLESRIMVSGQAIESTSQEIIKLRESELYPQLVELVKGLMSMWRSLYESHQVQMHIVEQLKYINNVDLSTEPTTEIHRQSTLQLELEVQQWHLSFCNLVKSQRDYIQSLTGWLRLSLFQFSKNSSTQTKQDSAIYTLCEEWQLVADNAPDNVASEGIKALLNVIHAIVVQQFDEQKQKRRLDSFSKELEKKTMELRALESKYGPSVYSGPDGRITGRVADKRAKVEALRVRVEEEKGKYEKSIGVTRAMTLNNLQLGLPHVFQAVTGFANVWTHAFESVCNQANILEEVKSIMN
ncbi:protein ALTERED PHOSPHATE STARVATION RESPONSE 1-like [Bidens hawaiensis]|uniref:protein ALTERED PHOSPHATE STARVATION RESPONSE 1-like n=1 Tax=Bidens hawaiensis TaxID=980011 RepID=UPI00404949A8